MVLLHFPYICNYPTVCLSLTGLCHTLALHGLMENKFKYKLLFSTVLTANQGCRTWDKPHGHWHDMRHKTPKIMNG